MSDIQNERAIIGGNNPPQDLLAEIRERHKSLFDQAAELMDASAQVPEKITNDETHAKVIELVRKIKAVNSQLDAVRKIEAEPFSEKVKLVNAAFKTKIDPLKDRQDKCNSLHEDYSKAKAAAEKRRLEEEAEKRRIESERLQKEAQEAEARARAAEQARLEAERKAREAEEARARAVKEKEQAERRAEEERQKALELAAQRKKAEEEEAERRRLAKLQQDKDEEEAAARKEQERIEREAHEKRMDEMRAQEEEAKEARRKAEEEAAASRAKAEEERKNQRASEDAAAAAKREEKTAGRDSRDALESAVREDRKADRIDEKVNGSEADLARSRSEHGAVGTLTRRWTARVVDREKLDITALWPFVNGEAVEAALWKWMMSQAQDKRVMAGAIMEEETVGIVR